MAAEPSSSSLVDVEELQQKLNSQKPENYRWTYEHGRRYASGDLGDYFLPNDDPEIERLNEQHWIFTQAKDGKIFNAPLDPKQPGFRILDVGCGSGIWCMQMADAFPDSKITGIDISPIQPNEKPSNVVWIIHNVETDWPFSPNDQFDYIRLSLLNGSFAEFGKIVDRIIQHLKPGGYVEQQEWSMGRLHLVDNDGDPIALSSDINELPPILRWDRLMAQAGNKRGRSLSLAPKLKDYYTAAGFIDVNEKVYPMPIGTWPKDEKQKLIGSHVLVNGVRGMDGLTTMLFTKTLGWKMDETKDFVEKVKQDICNDDLHKYLDLVVVYGQKPLR